MKKKDAVLRQLDRDIKRLDEHAAKMKGIYEAAQANYQKALDELKAATNYRAYRMSQNGPKATEKPIAYSAKFRDVSSGSFMTLGEVMKLRNQYAHPEISHARPIPSPVRAKIVDFLKKSGGVARRKDILEHLRKENQKFGDNNLWMAMNRMQALKIVRKTKPGVYELVS